MFTNKTLKISQATKQYNTSSSAENEIETQTGVVKLSDCSDIFHNGPSASAGDAWCGLELVTVPGKKRKHNRPTMMREIHQYKLVNH